MRLWSVFLLIVSLSACTPQVDKDTIAGRRAEPKAAAKSAEVPPRTAVVRMRTRAKSANAANRAQPSRKRTAAKSVQPPGPPGKTVEQANSVDPAPPRSLPAGPDYDGRMEKLKEMYDRGLITREEYRKKRAEILKDL